MTPLLSESPRLTQYEERKVAMMSATIALQIRKRIRSTLEFASYYFSGAYSYGGYRYAYATGRLY